MNLALAKELLAILKNDKRFKVYITRGSKGYTSELAAYFTNHAPDINAFKQNAKQQMKDEIALGTFIKVKGVPHPSVNQKVSLRLYGINKWANENKIDAVIHLHFDDYPRVHSFTIGKYKGFTVYMPEHQMANAKESNLLAKSIHSELIKKYSTSTYPPESGGLVEDQKLIALGANGSLAESVRSVLIEYGYIYRFGRSAFRHQSYKKMASLTAIGIKNYFFPK